jgi:hypothetical protein
VKEDPTKPAIETAPTEDPGRGTLTGIVLIAANLVPIFGAIALGWNVFDIVMLYWIENVIVGLINVMRMALIRTGEHPGVAITGKVFTIGFFVVHYGIFTLVHGIFVFSVFGESGFGTEVLRELAGIKWAVLALLASHLVSFFVNFVGGREFAGRTLGEQMSAPYPRMMALHVAIVLGAWAVEALGQPLPLLVILVVGKVTADWKLHTRTHRKAGGTHRIADSENTG